MTHAQEPIAAAGQARYTHGWVPINKAAKDEQAARAAKMAARTGRSTAVKTARDAKKAAKHAERMAEIKSKLKASQSRVQARGALNSANLAELQELAGDLKLSADGDKPALVNRIAMHRHPSLLQAAAYANTPGTHYADPGLQPDGKKRYPLDSEKECRAAWSYISMPRNAAKYSPEDLAKVKSAILTAGKKFGIQFAEPVAASAAPMTGVELARPGNWQLSTGAMVFDAQDLRDAADFYAASGQTRVPIGFGHQDQRFDGDPAFGWLSNIRYAEDGKGPVLLGDLVDMDDWLAAAAPARWPNRSIEGFKNLSWNGRTYSLAVTRLALLGATPPAMPTLRSLADIREAIAAAAADSSAEFVSASAPAIEELSEQDTTDPAVEAVVPQQEMETGMDPAKFREALGLTADDFSDEEVMEAAVAAGFVAPPAPPEGEAVPVAAGAAPGTVVMASSTYEQLQGDIKTLNAFVAKTKRDERDDVIAAAVKAGKFTPAQRPQFASMWDSNPDATRNLINSLTPNSALAVAASGYSREVEGNELDEYAALFGTGQKAS